MSHNHRKRKHRPTGGATHRNYPAVDVPEPEQFLAHHQGYQSQSQSQPQVQPWTAPDTANTVDPLRALYIQAHEADLVHGDAAESLEVVEYRAVLTASGTRDVSVLPRVGSALIQWGDSTSAAGAQARNGVLPAKARAVGVGIVGSDEEDEDTTDGGELALPPVVAGSPSPIWVDRYDARLLLSALPSHPPPPNPNPNPNLNVTTTTPSLRAPLHRPASPSGWSDLASDAEDTFFFTPDEAADYHREKRRRVLQQSREDRLRARMHEDGVDGEAEVEDVWGGSDEEPNETQHALMARTAAHLLSSPNPAQLEMRILANHGGDRRFAFLRGRWKHAWGLAKAKARLEKKNGNGGEKEKGEGRVVLSSALAGYGSGSSSDAGAEADGPPEPREAVPPAPAKTDEVAAQERRRQRLRKWTEERRASQQQQSSSK